MFGRCTCSSRCLDRLDELGGADEVARRARRGHGLGERRGVDDVALARVELEHRRQLLAGEADRDVRVVLEDREAELLGEREQRRRFSSDSVYPAGFWKFGMMCASLGEPRRAELPQRVDADAVGLELDHVDVGAAALEAEQRAVVGGLLDDDGSPAATRWSNRNASACIEPLVTSTFSGCTPWRSAIQVRSGT
jgi:hypothetical protein